MRPLLIQGMRGLGDNIFQRPFVKAAAARREVWLETPWPELWADVPGLRLTPTLTSLRTQSLNIARQAGEVWAGSPPADAETVRLSYAQEFRRGGSIMSAFDRALPLEGAPFEFDLPDMGPAPIDADKPIAVVRPVTVRKEWPNAARNPLPQYVAEIADELRKTHYVVVVAHLAAGEEWALRPMPIGDVHLLNGELGVRDLLALVDSADLVVGGGGWLIPAAVALRTPGFFVLGGMLAENAPDKVTDRRMDLRRIGWGMPARPCHCHEMAHDCDREIPDLMSQFAAWRARL